MHTPPPVPGPKKTPGLAIASLVLGIIAVLGGVVILIPTVLAIVFGHVSLSKINKDSSLGGRGIAIAGLVTGYGSFASVIVIGMLAAMAIPAFNKVRSNSLGKVMQNDARMIGAAAQQCFLEDSKIRSITFNADPVTGEVSGPLSVYVRQLGRGIIVVDGELLNATDGFSLMHPDVNGGREVKFGADGRLLQPLAP
jgi:hypothetical protein